MSVNDYVQTNVRLFAGGADLTSRSNKVEFGMDAEAKDSTNYGSAGWKEFLAGLADSALTGEGQWEAGDLTMIDDTAWSNIGSVGAYTVCPDGAAVGSLAWVIKALEAQYKLGGQVGDVAPWTTAMNGDWPIARGLVLHPPGTARSSTGNGTAVQNVAVSSTQYLYSSLHVYSISGSSVSLTVKVQSNADNTFGSPTDQITFTAVTDVTGVGGQIKRLVGPITDTWFRVVYTISGTGSFLFVSTVGVK